MDGAFNRSFGIFFYSMPYVLHLSVILVQVSLSAVFEVSGNPVNPRASKRTTICILPFCGLCYFMPRDKQP